jgi:hypothetical protein
MAAKKTVNKPVEDLPYSSEMGDQNAEIFNFAADKDFINSEGFVEVGGDIAGFWAPEEGEGLAGRLVDMRTMNATKGGERSFFVIELERPCRIYDEENPNKAALAGARVAVWESFRTADLARIYGDMPRIKMLYEGKKDTSNGFEVKLMRLAFEPEMAQIYLRRLQEARAAHDKQLVAAIAQADASKANAGALTAGN